MKVFSNTTPFIALASIDQLPLLPRLFDSVYVAQSVIDECAEKYPGSRVIIDERLGRNVAEYMGLKVTGTLGVLAKAKATGLIPSFYNAAQEMRAQGIRYSEGLVQRIAHHLGEHLP